MSNKSFWIFYSCERKAKFISKEEAENKITEIKNKDNVQMRAYKCKNCGGYHLAKRKD